MRSKGQRDNGQRRGHETLKKHLRGQTSPLKAADWCVLEGGRRCGGPAQAAAPQCVGGAPPPPLPPHPTLQYPSLPPNHLTSLINIRSFFRDALRNFREHPLSNCFTVHWDVIPETHPNQSSLQTILTSTIATDPTKYKNTRVQGGFFNWPALKS